MNHLPGPIAAALAPFAPPPVGQDIETTQYVKALQRHDWFYDWADDSREWHSGREQRRALDAMRKRVDANGAIWNLYAPPEMQIRGGDQ